MASTVFCHSTYGEPLVLFKTGYSLLSNFNPRTPFTIDGVTYFSGEAWYQASKAAHFEDFESRDLIMATKSPKKTKELGQHIKGYKEDEWNKVCLGVMLRGVREKMKQHRGARELLLSTNNAIIGEASAFDSFWGIGVDINNSASLDFKFWNGQNEMGKCLMKVRDELMYQRL
jgi:ribA/ribD-fused uncharacterized protein